MIDKSFIHLEAIAGAALRVTRLDVLLRRIKRGKVPILMYHSIVNDDADEDACLALVGMTVRESRFRQHMEYVATNYRTVLLREFLRWRQGEGPLPDNPCIITFDDGLFDVYERAVPILEEFHLNGVVFPIGSTILPGGKSYLHELYAVLDSVPVDVARSALGTLFMDFPSGEISDKVSLRNWASHYFHQLNSGARPEKLEELREATTEFSEASPAFMNAAQLKELASSGFEIGTHSMGHGFLSKLDYDELEKEIVQSKDLIGQVTGILTVSFCYPFGVRDSRAIEILQLNGFSGAVTMIEGLNDRQTGAWELRRIRVTWDLPASAFVFRLLGLRGFLWTVREWIRKFRRNVGEEVASREEEAPHRAVTK